MKVLHVQTLGKLQVQFDSRVVTAFPTRHVEELLGYFLLNQHIRHRREKLIHILWPHCEPEKARGRFSTALWRLRTLLDKLGTESEEYLQATREWVAFEPRRAPQLDLHYFEVCLEQANTAADDELREQALGEALHTYKGELYEGIYSDWCLIERERLARQRLRALGQLMACRVRRQAYEEAIELGQAILHEDPLREEVHRAVMYCYWQLGQRPQAVRQFQLCAQGLMDELQILPMPETIAMYRRIVDSRFTKAVACVEAPCPPRLRAAYADFQHAAETLNALLDETTRPAASESAIA